MECRSDLLVSRNQTTTKYEMLIDALQHGVNSLLKFLFHLRKLVLVLLFSLILILSAVINFIPNQQVGWGSMCPACVGRNRIQTLVGHQLFWQRFLWFSSPSVIVICMCIASRRDFLKMFWAVTAFQGPWWCINLFVLDFLMKEIFSVKYSLWNIFCINFPNWEEGSVSIQVF
jgi:hypothetical protein